MSRPRRVIGYARVSSEEQARGSSLQDQQDSISTYAKTRGLKVTRFYVEAESAVHEKIERREQIRALMRDVSEGDLVLCDKLDRWSRDPEFTYGSVRQILKAGASFYAVSDRVDPSTSEGDTALGFRILFAREEHKRIKERMVGTRRILRDKGYYVDGLAPLGYRRQEVRGPERNVLVIEPKEAEVVRRTFRMCIAGRALSYIAAAVERPIDQVAKTLRNRVYLGEVRNTRGEWITAKHPAIVDVDVFMRAGAALDERRHGGARPRQTPAETSGWILRDVAICARCGGRMGAAYGKREPNRRYYYRCSKGCEARLVRVDAVEKAFVPLVLERLAELREELAGSPPEAEAPAVDFAERRAKLQRRRDRYIEAFADESMTRDDLRAAMARLDAERLRLDAEERAQRRPSALASPVVRREALREVGVLERAWKAAGGAGRRELVAQLALAVRIETGKAPAPEWRSAEALIESE